MTYQILRDGQHYGPYTLDVLRQYVASGNVLLTDMVRATEGGESAPWITVAELLGDNQAPPVTPPYTPPVAAHIPAAQAYAAGAPAYGAPASIGIEGPPNLPWWLYGLIAFFTGWTVSPFVFVWNFFTALWLKRIEPMSNAVLLSGASMGLYVLSAYTWLHTNDWFAYMHHYEPGVHMVHDPHPLASLIHLSAWVVKLVWRFSQRADLERHYNTVEPIGLRLSPFMTFFFGGLYFQYHYNKINAIKSAAAFPGYPGPR